MLLNDDAFSAYDAIVVDEVHERSACSCDGPDARQMLRYLLSDSELADYSPEDYNV